ncbi:MAG TPA: hypothetical protein VFI16_05855 [Anaeromyxobacteraceae bacterium]|nr:hypothetical protein [Anaeromyxobacteraceae bacterium]
MPSTGRLTAPLALAAAVSLTGCAGVPAPRAAAPAERAAAPAAIDVPRQPNLVPGVSYPEEPIPRGNPEDVALWVRTRDATNNSMVVLWNAKSLSYRIQYFKYYQRLDARIAKGTPEERERARALRKRMEEAAISVQRAAPQVGSMDMHSCRRKMLYLKQAIEDDPAGPAAAGMQQARFEAWDCVKEMEGMTRVLEPEVNELSAAMDEIDDWMPKMPEQPVPAPAAAPPGARRPGT